MYSISEYNEKRLKEAMAVEHDSLAAKVCAVAGGYHVSTDALDTARLGESVLLSNSLNLYWGAEGAGKSYAAVSMAKLAGVPTYYFDFEGNNKQFVEHCKKNGVEYLFANNLIGIPGAREDIDIRSGFGGGSFASFGDDDTKPFDEEPIKPREIKFSITPESRTEMTGIANIMSIMNKPGALYIIDSLSDVFDGNNNDAQETARFMRELHHLAASTGNTILILDHATKQRDRNVVVGEKVEGSESGKKKKTALSVHVTTKGGHTTMTVDRSRNKDEFIIGDTFDLDYSGTLSKAQPRERVA